VQHRFQMNGVILAATHASITHGEGGGGGGLLTCLARQARSVRLTNLAKSFVVVRMKKTNSLRVVVQVEENKVRQTRTNVGVLENCAEWNSLLHISSARYVHQVLMYLL